MHSQKHWTIDQTNHPLSKALALELISSALSLLYIVFLNLGFSSFLNLNSIYVIVATSEYISSTISPFIVFTLGFSVLFSSRIQLTLFVATTLAFLSFFPFYRNKFHPRKLSPSENQSSQYKYLVTQQTCLGN